MTKITLSLVNTLLLMFLVINAVEQVSAQASGATVSTSVNGFITLTGNLPGTVQGESNTQLLQINTTTGAVSVLLDESMPFSSPQISPSGDYVAFYQPQQGLSIYTFATSAKNTIIPPDFAVTRPQSWSTGDTDLLNIDYRFDSNSQTFTYSLQQFNLASSSVSVILSQVQEQPLTAVPLPVGISQLNLSSIRQAAWNPSYPDWLLLQFEGAHPTLLTPDGFERSIYVTVLHNKQTGQSIVLNDLLSDEISSGQLVWSTTGTEIILTANDDLDRKTYIIAVNGLDASPSLQVLTSAVNDHVLLDWFGISDLLFTTSPDNQTGDSVYYISQIIDGNWFTQEFIRLLDTDFDRVGPSDWFNMTNSEEQYQLSCLFDQAMPARIGVGQRARVNFTDGTPLRLRSEPSLDATEITQMSEGTEFDVIGGSACVNDNDYYRFWQLELDDGTIGWAAEASMSDYFMEPV